MVKYTLMSNIGTINVKNVKKSILGSIYGGDDVRFEPTSDISSINITATDFSAPT